MFRALICLVAVSCGSVSLAAELPSHAAKNKTEAPKARTCEIEGQPGFALPGGCVRVSGYVSAGVAAGNVKH